MGRKILLLFCTISFFEVLILLPNLFLVSKFNIISVVFIAILGFVDTYIIDFLEEIYDNVLLKYRGWKDERKKKKELA